MLRTTGSTLRTTFWNKVSKILQLIITIAMTALMHASIISWIIFMQSAYVCVCVRVCFLFSEERVSTHVSSGRA